MTHMFLQAYLPSVEVDTRISKHMWNQAQEAALGVLCIKTECL